MPDIQEVVQKVLKKYSQYGIDEERTLDKLVKPAVLACSTVADSEKKFFGCLNDSFVYTRKKLASIADEFRGAETNEENLNKLKQRLNEVCMKGAGKCLGDLNDELIKACSHLPTMDKVIECVEEGAYYAQLANSNIK